MTAQGDPTGRPPDAYEAAYMTDQSAILHRDRMTAPWWYHALLLLPVVFVWIIWAIGGSKPPPIAVPIVLTPLLLLFWLLFSMMRITVTKQHVIVQYGVFGPRIPIASIVSAEEVDYDWTRTSYGIHRAPGGVWVYNMFGDDAHGVRIVYEVRGARRTVLLGTRGAAAIAAAIAKARGQGSSH